MPKTRTHPTAGPSVAAIAAYLQTELRSRESMIFLLERWCDRLEEENTRLQTEVDVLLRLAGDDQ